MPINRKTTAINDPGALPSAPDAERDLVGAVLYDQAAFDQAKLKANEFYIDRFRWFWEAFEAIHSTGDAIDESTVRRQLEKAGKLAEIERAGIFPLTTSLLHVESNAHLVNEKAGRRRILAIAQDIAAGACDGKTPDEVVSKALVDLGKVKPYLSIAVKNRWTLAELEAAEFPLSGGPIPGKFPTGLTVLGGRPKRGKSWLMMQAGGALASGGKFLDQDLQINRVLYYALEDPPRRLQERTRKLGIDPSALIEFKTEIKPLHLGGISEIAAEAENFQMIIIDTIRRALPGKDFNKDGALFDDVLGQLQAIAQGANMAIVVILHTRKSFAGLDPDPVDDVLGSTGLTASADCVLALYRDSTTMDGRLLGRQRDGEDLDLTISFDPTTCAWQLKGKTVDVRTTETEAEILAALADLGKSKAADVAKEIGKDRGNTAARLANLWTRGRIKKELIDNISYYYVETPTNE